MGQYDFLDYELELATIAQEAREILDFLPSAGGAVVDETTQGILALFRKNIDKAIIQSEEYGKVEAFREMLYEYFLRPEAVRIEPDGSVTIAPFANAQQARRDWQEAQYTANTERQAKVSGMARDWIHTSQADRAAYWKHRVYMKKLPKTRERFSLRRNRWEVVDNTRGWNMLENTYRSRLDRVSYPAFWYFMEHGSMFQGAYPAKPGSHFIAATEIEATVALHGNLTEFETRVSRGRDLSEVLELTKAYQAGTTRLASAAAGVSKGYTRGGAKVAHLYDPKTGRILARGK